MGERGKAAVAAATAVVQRGPLASKEMLAQEMQRSRQLQKQHQQQLQQLRELQQLLQEPIDKHEHLKEVLEPLRLMKRRMTGCVRKDQQWDLLHTTHLAGVSVPGKDGDTSDDDSD